MEKIKIPLSQRFINGLKNYNLTKEELKDWKYYGGNKGSHKNYFEKTLKQSIHPPPTDKCVCGQSISENCYIINENKILVLGNCCIKKFVPKSGRTCEICEKPHKNRKVNRCKDCRKKICDICDEPLKEDNIKYTTCYYCYEPPSYRRYW